MIFNIGNVNNFSDLILWLLTYFVYIPIFLIIIGFSLEFIKDLILDYFYYKNNFTNGENK